MEIVKQNEVFRISETSDAGWEMNGTASYSTEGNMTINFSARKEGVEMGNFNYAKFKGNDRISVNYNVSEADRSAFITYADTVINNVLNHFA